ncbi:MAG: hypothetical protein H7Y11_09035 [Armatimonadetes bacterium]|nr:hypothetical protein [Anaerolineae bacterium]
MMLPQEDLPDELPLIPLDETLLAPVDAVTLDEDTNQDDEQLGTPVRYRGATNDPVFGYLIALALSVGLSPLIAGGNADLRYTLAWGVLALFGVLAWLFGSSARVGQETPDSAIWGFSFGVILGAPLLAFGSSTLSTAVGLLFAGMSVGTLLAYLVFVMPLAETLFFRGVLQETRPFWVVSAMGTFWSIALFFPMMDLSRYPLVVLVICLTLAMMNLMYSYVRQRNGLAAAWICQIIVNLVLVFLPYLGRGGI